MLAMNAVVQHLADHWGDVLTGATAVGLVAHAVNTFPTPTNKYGQWFIGVLQFAVGQRVSGANTLAGKDSVVTGVAKPVMPVAPPFDPPPPAA
jgi:hypothetical protein